MTIQTSVRYYLCFSKTERCLVNVYLWVTWKPSFYTVSFLDDVHKMMVRADIYWAIQRQTLFDMLYIYFGHLVWRAIGKDPNAGQDWGQEERRGDNGGDGWMVSSTQATRVWANSGRQWKTGKPWCAAVHGAAKSRTRLKDWTICIKAFNPLITTLWNELLNIIPVYRWGNWSKD